MTDLAPLRILVVEDEPSIREGVVDLLSFHGFSVDAVGDGAAALQTLEAQRFSLIVLDLMIPPPDGLEVLATLRRGGDKTPVLVLTARGSESDVVEGLERGADDYVTKPFGVKELVARIRGLLRRAQEQTPADGGTALRQFALGDALVDLANARITYGQGTTLELTAREATLLAFLHTHRERIVTRAELLVGVWGYRDGTIETRTVDVHVQKLRAKLRALGGHTEWIETARGIGYRLGHG